MSSTLNGSPALDAINAALATVQDPEISRPLTELGMVKDVQIGAEGAVRVEVYLTVSGCPMRETITNRVTQAVSAVPGVTGVQVVLDVMNDEQRAELRRTVRGTDAAEPVIPFAQPGSLTRVYAVASGKGGVGKSSVTVNLAASLARRGLSVGVVDADIYGHSVPRMLGVDDKPTQVDNMIMPPQSYGVKVISIGMFTPGNTPVVWRGPMLHRALQQFLADVWWGDLDVLLMDLPPGTGDVAISVAQLVPNAEILVVTTPQHAAAEVAERAGTIAMQTHQQVVGVIENMSWLELPDGSRMEIFGSGGGQAVSDALTKTLGARVPLLGQIPLDTRLRESGDAGAPIVLAEPDSPAAQALEKIADGLAVRQRGLSGMSLGLTPVRHVAKQLPGLERRPAREAAYRRLVTDQLISESITVDAPPAVVFAILADPRQHSRIDGSGSVQSIMARAGSGQPQRPDVHRPDEALRPPVPDPQPGGRVRGRPADRLAALHRQPVALRARADAGRRHAGHRDVRPLTRRPDHRLRRALGEVPRAHPRRDHRNAGAAEEGRRGRRSGGCRQLIAGGVRPSPTLQRRQWWKNARNAGRYVASASNGGGVAWLRGRDDRLVALPRRTGGVSGSSSKSWLRMKVFGWYLRRSRSRSSGRSSPSDSLTCWRTPVIAARTFFRPVAASLASAATAPGRR